MCIPPQEGDVKIYFSKMLKLKNDEIQTKNSTLQEINSRHQLIWMFSDFNKQRKVIASFENKFRLQKLI